MAQDTPTLLILFQFLIFIFSAIIHEVSHGYAALYLGDPTAKYEGRLTLNPLKHIEAFGTIILPILLFLIQSPVVFGWAKPVPYNPYNLKDPKRGGAIIALAGPLSNIAIATVFGLVLRFTTLPEGATTILVLIVVINLVLALFNLVPIPPLDGSKVLFAFFPPELAGVQHFLERYSFAFVLLFVFFLWQYIVPVVYTVFHLLTGLYF